MKKRYLSFSDLQRRGEARDGLLTEFEFELRLCEAIEKGKEKRKMELRKSKTS